MAGFKDGNFATRVGTMGDTAEGVFDQLNPKHHKLGLNRPPLYVAGLPRYVRYTPDRLIQDRYVEIMGIGRDQTLKLKIEKALTQISWGEIMPVDLFVYDQSNHRWWQAPLWDWIDPCVQHAKVHSFPDNDKRYWALQAKHFPAEATDVEQA